MEPGLKNLFFRRRSKSKPPTPRDTPEDAFRQTSSYSTVPSGPAPKVGALPIKPSQEKKTRKSFSHAKADSDGLQEIRQAVESANVGRPRTSPGVKPYFVGVSKPSSSEIPSGPSTRGPSVDIQASGDAAPPPVPPLPDDLDSLRGPRYHDIIQFASKQQVSRATFNEHVATRNMGIPRKSVDIFETEVNQLSHGRYNEYVAMRNIERTRQSIDHFEEDVALRNAALPDTQPTDFEATRLSTEGPRHQSRANSMDKAVNKTPGHRVARPETSANTPASRTDRGEPFEIGHGGPIPGFDVTTKANPSQSQFNEKSKRTAHHRQHSWKQNNHPAELASIPQSRTADFMPPEWLDYGKTAVSANARTRSMTAATPPRFTEMGALGLHDSTRGRVMGESQTPTQRSWDTRNQHSRHSTSKSLSVLEGTSGRDAFRSTTSMAQQSAFAERSTRQDRSVRGARNVAPGSLLRDSSATSSIRKRIDGSGRTVMDLTYEYPDSSADNVGQSAYHELLGEASQEIVYHNQRLDPSRSTLNPLISHASERPVIGGSGAFGSLPGATPKLSHASTSGEHKQATILSFATEAPSIESTVAIGDNTDRATSGSAFTPAGGANLADSHAAPSHHQATVPVESSARNPRPHDQVFPEDSNEKAFRQSEQVYATPDSLKSSDFTDPSRAFGVAARDFAVSPPQKQSPGMLKKRPQAQEARSDPSIPLLVSKLPARQDKVLHHISSFTLPAMQPRPRQSSRDQVAFDEDAFQRKQAEARAALARLERDLQENLTVAFNSPNPASAQAALAQFPDPFLKEGGPVPPTSRFSSVHVPTSVYQTKVIRSAFHSDPSPSQKGHPPRPSNLDLAGTNDLSGSSVQSSPRHNNRNSTISTISETEAEQPAPTGSAPAPTVPLSSGSDWGRPVNSRHSLHRSRYSTASTGSGASVFSVPPHLVPERRSSIRDSDLPAFSIGDAEGD